MTESVVQASLQSIGSGSGPLVVPLTTHQGNPLVLYVVLQDTVANPTCTVTDSAGNTWARKFRLQHPIRVDNVQEGWQTTNPTPIAGAPNDVSIAPSDSTTALTAIVWEVSGVSPLSPIDQVAQGSSPAQNFNALSGTTPAQSSPGELALGGAFTFLPTVAPASWTFVPAGTPTNVYDNGQMVGGDLNIGASIAGQEWSVTWGNAAHWLAACWTLLPAPPSSGFFLARRRVGS